jgi:hypothetical protein
MGFHLLRCALDQEDRRENQKPASNGPEPDVSKEVPQQDEHRYQTKAKPPRQAAQLLGDTHGLVSR